MKERVMGIVNRRGTGYFLIAFHCIVLILYTHDSLQFRLILLNVLIKNTVLLTYFMLSIHKHLIIRNHVKYNIMIAFVSTVYTLLSLSKVNIFRK